MGPRQTGGNMSNDVATTVEPTPRYFRVIRYTRTGHREVLLPVRSEAYARDYARWYDGAVLEEVTG